MPTTTMTSTQSASSNTYAYFSGWAQAISTAFATFGWLQTVDTGQVMWTGLVLTQVSMAGSVATYSYTTLTGRALNVNQALTITSMTNAVNNGTFRVTGVTVATSTTGTFTITNALGTNEGPGSTGAVTLYNPAWEPATPFTVYEIWGFGDTIQTGGTSPFYLKVEYGAPSANNTYTYFTLGTGTTGAGVLSGNVGTRTYNAANYGNSATAYNCYFSGNTNRISILMWDVSAYCWVMTCERQHDSAGNDLNNYATLLVAGPTSWSSQQSVFKVGTGSVTTAESSTTVPRWATCLPITATTGVVNSQTMVSPVFPLVGQVDNPLMGAVVGLAADFADSQYSVTIYGAPRNYYCTKSTPVVGNQGVGYPMMRYE